MSAENIHEYLYKVLLRELHEAIPMPDCPVKKAHAIWKREEAIKLLIEKLGTKHGITVRL